MLKPVKRHRLFILKKSIKKRNPPKSEDHTGDFLITTNSTTLFEESFSSAAFLLLYNIVAINGVAVNHLNYILTCAQS